MHAHARAICIELSRGAVSASSCSIINLLLVLYLGSGLFIRLETSVRAPVGHVLLLLFVIFDLFKVVGEHLPLPGSCTGASKTLIFFGYVLVELLLREAI